MTIKKWVLIVLLVGNSLYGRGQWSTDLSQNTRVSAGLMHTFAYGTVAGDDGSVLVTWAESTGNASIMYAHRYRLDGTIVFSKKELFRFTLSDCTKEGFSGLRLLKASGSDDVFVIYTLNTGIVIQGGKSTYLQYQIISFADGSTKIPNTGNENRGLNLGYDYDTNAPIVFFDANFIRDGGNKVVVTWSQKNNPTDSNRGGGGALATLSDLRIAILDASNLTAPIAYYVENDAGEQTYARVFAQGERIFVSFMDRGSTIAVRKYRYPLNGAAITKQWSGGNAQYLGTVSDTENLGIQPSLDDTAPIVVYTAVRQNLVKIIKAHPFNPATGAIAGTPVTIVTADQLGGIKSTGGAFSLNSTFIYTRNNRQMIRRFLGSTPASAETPITQKSHGGDPTFEGVKLSDSPERYLLAGENRDNGELYGQIIRFDNTSAEGVREWGDNAKIVSNAPRNKTGARISVLNSNALFFLWKDDRNRTIDCTGDIYCQVLDKDGNVPVKTEIKDVKLSKTTFCGGQAIDNSFTVSFNATPANGTFDVVVRRIEPTLGTDTDSWSVAKIGSPITVTIPNDELLNTGPGKFLIFVKETTSSPVMSEASTDTLKIIAPSAKPTVSPPITLCTGAAAMPLTATGTNLRWYTTATGGTGIAAAPTPSTSTAGTTSYYVTQTTNGCESLREEIKVTVTSTPTIAATANNTKPLSVCAGGAVTLSATDGFTSYNWTGPGITTGANTRSPQLTTPATGSYVVTGTSSCGTARDTVKVTVNPIPVPNASSSKSTYIVGETIQFNSGNGTGYTYLWTGPGVSGAETRQNPTIANAQTTMTGDYTVTITANGCEAKGTVTITVTTQPVTGIDNVSATPLSACPGAGVDVNFTILPSNGVGTFNVYLADANGQKIGASIGNGTRSPIRATLPAPTAPGNTYRILVETSPTISKSSGSVFTVLQPATVQMLSPTKDTSIVARKTGDNLSARMRIQGSGPFTLTFSAGTRTVRNAGDTTLTFRFENDGIFSFQSISGACGAGALTGVRNVQITLKRVVAVEEDTLAESGVVVFPNPISDRLNVEIKNGKAGQTTQLRLYDGKGSLLKTQSFYNDRYQWEMGSFPVGNYLLEVVNGDKKQSFRVIKE